MSMSNSSIILNSANSTASSDTTWLVKIAVPLSAGVNGVSLFFSTVVQLILIYCYIIQPKIFSRLSLKLIATISVANSLIHVSYIYSLYFTDTGNCIASTVLFVFSNLWAATLTSCLGFTLFIIAVLKKGVHGSAFVVYVTTTFLFSFVFSCIGIPSGSIGFDPVNGCWFIGPHEAELSWISFFAPLMFFIIIDFIGAIVLFVALNRMKQSGSNNNRSAMSSAKQDIEMNDVKNPEGTTTNGSNSIFNKNMDSLKYVATQVNGYIFVPFVCQVLACVALTEGDNASIYLNFFQIIMGSMAGTITFFIFCFDRTVQRVVLGRKV